MPNIDGAFRQVIPGSGLTFQGRVRVAGRISDHLRAKGLDYEQIVAEFDAHGINSDDYEFYMHEYDELLAGVEEND